MSTTSKSRKNFKLKNVSFISSLSLNNTNLFNFLPPKRINTSTSRSSNTNRASSRHKRNSSRDMQSDKRSTHFKNDCSYSNVNTTNYIKTSCYLKSLNNYNFNNKSKNSYDNKKNWDGTMAYSLDGKTWTEWDGTDAIEGKTIYMRGTGNTKLTASEEKIMLDAISG